MSRRMMGMRRGGALRVPSASGLLLPYTISGLTYWLDPERYNDGANAWTLNGTKVASAPSRESAAGTIDAAKTVAQGTDANRPTLNVADAAFNNRNTVSFSGASSTGLISSILSPTVAAPTTMYVVGYSTDKTAINRFATFSNTVAYLFASNVTTGYANIQQTSAVVTTVDVANGTGHVMCGIFNGSSSAMYVDNSSSGTSGTTGTSAMNAIYLGRANTATQFLTGKIATVLVYSGAHTAAQRALIMQWLGSRYGITVT